MGVAGGEPAAVVDAGVVAVAAAARLRLVKITVPAAAARIGVPLGHGDVDARVVLVAAVDVRGPKPETTGPLDRPDQAAAAARLDRPGRQRRRAGSRRAARRSCPGSRRRRRPALPRAALILLSARDAARRGSTTSAAWRSAPPRGRSASACSSAAIASRAASIRFLAARSRATVRLTWSRSSRTRPTTASSMPWMPFQVLGAGREVVVAVGAEDHAEHVGGAGLIHRDQPLAQRDQRPLAGGR